MMDPNPGKCGAGRAPAAPARAGWGAVELSGRPRPFPESRPISRPAGRRGAGPEGTPRASNGDHAEAGEEELSHRGGVRQGRAGGGGCLGLLATRLYMNRNSLLRFDAAIRSIRRSDPGRGYGGRENVDGLLSVMGPVAGRIRGDYSGTIALDDGAIVENLRAMHPDDWQEYAGRLVAETSRMESRPEAGPGDIGILEDVADALDAECAGLFRDMIGR